MNARDCRFEGGLVRMIVMLGAVSLGTVALAMPPSDRTISNTPLVDPIKPEARVSPTRPVNYSIHSAASGGFSDTGADDCIDAVVMALTVGPVGSPNSVTTTGDNSGATGPDCLSGSGDLGWWEGFEINQCAQVTIEFCGTDPIARPSWIILYEGCDCVIRYFADFSDRGATCGDANLSFTYGGLPAGTYHYPVYTVPGDLRCGDTGAFCANSSECNAGVPCTNNLHPYQLRISAEATLGSCCDQVAETCTDVKEADCNGANEVWSCGQVCCETECRNPSGPEFDALGVELLSRVSIAEFATFRGTPGDPYIANEMWAYTSPLGEKYAIIGFSTGTGFVRVTDPRNPQIVAFIDGGVDWIWRDMAVYQTYVYVVNDGGSGRGLQIIDVNAIDNDIVFLVTESDLGAGFATAHNVFVNEDSGYLYLPLPNLNGFQGVTAVDLTDPINPTIAGFWADPSGNVFCHDVQVVSYTDGPNVGKEIAFCFAEGNGLVIADVTDKSNMFTISKLAYPTRWYCHQGWLTEDRKYVVFNDELDELAGTVSNTTTYIADVQDLANPMLAATFEFDTCNIDHNLHLRGDRVYEANYTNGLNVLDISNPLAPTRVAYFDTRPEDTAKDFLGAWGAYASPDQRTVFVSDLQRGLFVLCDEPEKPIASFTASSSVEFSNILIEFDGSASTTCDPSRTISIYEWDFDYDGITFDVDATGAVVQHQFTSAGTPTVALRVSDSALLKTSAGEPVPGIDIAILSVEIIMSPAPDPLLAADDGLGADYNRVGDFKMPASAVAGGEEVAIRVTLDRMYIDSDKDPDGCPVRQGPGMPDLSQFEGQVWYLGPPEAFHNNLPADPKWVGAKLQCAPFYRDWSALALQADFPGRCADRIDVSCSADADCRPGGACEPDDCLEEALCVSVLVDTIYYYGAAVVPCSIHAVQQATQSCVDSANEDCFSDPLEVRTALWGDVWPPFNNISFTDIGKEVDAFKSIPFVPGDPPGGAPNNWRAMLRGNEGEPGLTISFQDIGRTVDAFKTIAYFERGPFDKGPVLCTDP